MLPLPLLEALQTCIKEPSAIAKTKARGSLISCKSLLGTVISVHYWSSTP